MAIILSFIIYKQEESPIKLESENYLHSDYRCAAALTL